MAFVPGYVEQVEHMFNVLDAVYMSVYVNIVVVCVDAAYEFCFFSHLHSRQSTDGAFLFCFEIFHDFPVSYLQNVLRLAGLRVYHCPDASSVAIDLLVVGTADTEVTVGEIPHSTLNPCFHTELFVSLRHVFHLDSKSRQYPCLVDWVKIVHSEITVVGVEVCCIEQMVSEVPHEQLLGKVAVEWFRQESSHFFYIVVSYILFVVSFLFLHVKEGTELLNGVSCNGDASASGVLQHAVVFLKLAI